MSPKKKPGRMQNIARIYRERARAVRTANLNDGPQPETSGDEPDNEEE